MNLSLKTYLTLVISVVSGLPILVFLLWPYSAIFDQKLREVEERHLLLAQGIATSLEHYRDSLVAAMESFSIEVEKGAALAAQPIIETLDFYHVCVVRKSDGIIVASYLGNEIPCASQISERSLAFSTAMAAAGGVQFGGVIAPAQGTPRVKLVADLGDYFLQGALPTTMFKELQSKVAFGEKGYAIIVDRNGRVIAHPSADLERTRENLSDLPIVQAMMRHESGVMTFFSPRLGEEMIGGYTSVPVADWGVMVVQPVSEFKDAATKFNRDVGMILLVGLLASSLIAFFMARGFEQRIKGIQNVVGDIAKGTQGASFSEPRHPFEIKEFREMETGISAIVRKISASDKRYRNLFDNVPVASREEDLSGFKRRIDERNFQDVESLEHFLDDHPEFILECGKSIRVLDANAASLALHAARDTHDMNESVVKDFKSDSIQFIRATIIGIFKGETRGTRETTITSLSGTVRNLITTWCVLPGHEADYSRSLITSIDITEKIETEKALRHAQKMEAVGQLTGGIAHDFNNLLTVIGGNADLLALNPEHDGELIDPIQSAVKRGADLTQGLLAYSRKQTLQPQTINLLDLATKTGKILRRTLGTNIDVRIVADQEHLYVHADPGQVEAALFNLAINARDAMPRGGLLELAFRPADPAELEGLELESGAYIVCSVTDNGEGMTDDTLNRAFEPFFTTKGVGKGSGLGLSMVYGFTRQSHGAARIKSRLGQGTVIELFLPQVVDVQHDSPTPEKHLGCAQTGGLRILVLEDEPEVMKYLDKVLRKLGHTVLLAPTISAAWTFIDEGDQIDLLLSDVLLPGPEKGTDFARAMRRRNPDCPVIFISGYPNTDQIDANDDKTEWLGKPFSSQHLADIIRRLCFSTA